MILLVAESNKIYISNKDYQNWKKKILLTLPTESLWGEKK